MNQNQNIGIIGLGWLGLPLAKRLLALGYKVFGTTTQKDKLSQLKSWEITTCLWNEGQQVPAWISSLQTIVINIPPNKTTNYIQLVEAICSSVRSDCHVVFTSSTGIYSVDAGIANEQADIDKNSPLYHVEEVIKNQLNFTVLRLAGLIGNKRHPINYLSGKMVSNANWPVNLLTLEDILNAMEQVVSFSPTNQVFNLCHPEHPSKSEYYTYFAQKLNMELPVFVSGQTIGKSIDSSLFERTFGFKFQHSIYNF
jgi:nucleoside-diphosphate-sugar epimerase